MLDCYHIGVMSAHVSLSYHGQFLKWDNELNIVFELINRSNLTNQEDYFNQDKGFKIHTNRNN